MILNKELLLANQSNYRIISKLNLDGNIEFYPQYKNWLGIFCYFIVCDYTDSKLCCSTIVSALQQVQTDIETNQQIKKQKQYGKKIHSINEAIENVFQEINFR